MNAITLVVIAVALVTVFVVVMLGAVLIIRRNNRADTTSFDAFGPAPSMTPTPMTNEPVGASGDFMLTIADIFFIKGRGVVVTGRVDQGSITTGQRVQIGEMGGPTIEAQVRAIEAFRRQLTTAMQGDNIGLLLEGVTGDQLKQGMVITAM